MIKSTAAHGRRGVWAAVAVAALFAFGAAGPKPGFAAPVPHVEAAPAARDAALPRLTVDKSKVTVSGVSSGAYMAVQVHVAHSATFSGVGVLAGGPFYCAQANLETALGPCMKGNASGGIDVSYLVQVTQNSAATGFVDDTVNMAHDRVWVFSALNDTVVDHTVVHATSKYYHSYVSDPANIAEVFDRVGEHSQETDGFGESCYYLETSNDVFLNNCGYDAAGAMLQHLNDNKLKPAPTPTSLYNGTGELVAFHQPSYTVGIWSSTFGLDDTGYVYVPKGCKAGGEPCALHVALHGCLMNTRRIGLDFVQHAGYNAWADANNIIVVYPQAVSNALNPKACWDWWGYSGVDYASNIGVQISFIKNAVDAIMGS